MSGPVSGRVGDADQAGRATPGAAEASPPSGDHPSREALDAWLAANCGRGLPYGEATDLASALHGLAYALRQIEGTNKYQVFIGQCTSATTALRWALDYIASHEIAQAMSAGTAKTEGLGAKPASAVAESDAPNSNQTRHP